MSHDAPDSHESQAVGADDNTAFDTSFQNLQVNDEHAEDGEHEGARTEEEYAASPLTLRAIVSSKEAGVIIGKAGKNVADLRDETGVKAGVSKVVPGVHDRVLTVIGALDGIARAYAMVTQTLLDNPPSTMTAISPGQHPVRLLISHNQMGTIIGRSGLKIKHIQDVSGARMVAQKEQLPQSTERIVEVQGDANAIRMAIWEIGKCLIDDWQRGTGTILYDPAVRAQGGPIGASNGGNRYSDNRYSDNRYSDNRYGDNRYGDNRYGERGERNDRNPSRSYTRTGNGDDFSDPKRNDAGPTPRLCDHGSPGTEPPHEDGEEIQTQYISIPADMVGCIIGRGGAKIQEIRRESGARISIAKAPHDETGERMFTITGTSQNNEKALYMLYENLEREKQRRQNQTNNPE